MTGAGPELSSLATALADLTRRITAIAETYARAEREDLAAELYAAERALVGAHRRLTRVADAPGRQGSGPGHTDVPGRADVPGRHGSGPGHTDGAP